MRRLKPQISRGDRVLEPDTIRSYMYLSTSAKDGRALFDALVRLTEGRSWLARNGLIADR